MVKLNTFLSWVVTGLSAASWHSGHFHFGSFVQCPDEIWHNSRPFPSKNRFSPIPRAHNWYRAVLDSGHSWSPIGPKFGTNIDGAQIHVHTRLEHSRSNIGKPCQLPSFLRTLTSYDLVKYVKSYSGADTGSNFSYYVPQFNIQSLLLCMMIIANVYLSFSVIIMYWFNQNKLKLLIRVCNQYDQYNII
jgi:hypothetical protein